MKHAHQEKVGEAKPGMDKPVFCGITSALKSPCCTILESISDGVFTIDLNKRITSFNRAAETITGFKSAEAIGQYCFDVFRASICERQCALDQTLATGHSQVNVNAHSISRSGSQKAISISTATLKNENSEIIGGVETFRDLSELERLKRQLARNYTDEDIVGRHPRMREIFSFLPDIAESESSVLIEGPTGSGKELIARAIHQLSPRKTGPFVAVNCAALPETLLESELFGYSKGAFTDTAGMFKTVMLTVLLRVLVGIAIREVMERRVDVKRCLPLMPALSATAAVLLMFKRLVMFPIAVAFAFQMLTAVSFYQIFLRSLPSGRPQAFGPAQGL
jgi:PAS domain S-box-containing protein